MSDEKWTTVKNKYRTTEHGISIINALREHEADFSRGFCIPDYDKELVKRISSDLGYNADIKRWNVGNNLYSLYVVAKKVKKEVK